MIIYNPVCANTTGQKGNAMVLIRISYQTSQELESILKLLHPAIKSAKIKKGKQGAYKRAYIEIK